MSWLKRWKVMHWDMQHTPGSRHGSGIIMPSWYPPPLRRCALWLAKLWDDHPLGVIQTIAAVAAAVAAVVALLR